MKSYEKTLREFLSIPLSCGDEIFARFEALPGAVCAHGKNPLQRYVYIPGWRRDRVLLVAHTDTVWDAAYDKAFLKEREIEFENGVFKSANPECGIGADDRAGCALLWELVGCGHSILIVDGEEKGKHGAKYLKEENPKLYRTLNRHRYMIEFDWAGVDSCLFNQVDNTRRFKKYIKTMLGLTEGDSKGGTDLQVLCKSVCGVNISVGYHAYHTTREYLVLDEWVKMLDKVRIFLEKPQKRFRRDFFAPRIRLLRHCAGKTLRIIKRIFRR